MTLVPGGRLGSYEIIALIGVSGMGEVYRARDTQLNRDVALKVPPESVDRRGVVIGVGAEDAPLRRFCVGSWHGLLPVLRYAPFVPLASR